MRILGMVRRQFKDTDKECFTLMYSTFIRPHLEYAIQVWSPYKRRDIGCLEKVQRRATKLVKGLKNCSYEVRLAKLGLTTLEERRRRGDLIEAYKIITGKEKVRVQDFFNFHHSIPLSSGNFMAINDHTGKFHTVLCRSSLCLQQSLCSNRKTWGLKIMRWKWEHIA